MVERGDANMSKWDDCSEGSSKAEGASCATQQAHPRVESIQGKRPRTTHHGVLHPKSVEVRNRALETVALQVVGDDRAEGTWDDEKQKRIQQPCASSSMTKPSLTPSPHTLDRSISPSALGVPSKSPRIH
jgi:hypothetical protein